MIPGPALAEIEAAVRTLLQWAGDDPAREDPKALLSATFERLPSGQTGCGPEQNRTSLHRCYHLRQHSQPSEHPTHPNPGHHGNSCHSVRRSREYHGRWHPHLYLH